jgi:hypothetical protein
VLLIKVELDVAGLCSLRENHDLVQLLLDPFDLRPGVEARDRPNSEGRRKRIKQCSRAKLAADSGGTAKQRKLSGWDT